MNIKQIGSFYTPEPLAEFMITRLLEHFNDGSMLHVLEPSVGDGSFVKAFKKIAAANKLKSCKIKLTLVEIVAEELKKAEFHSRSFLKNIRTVNGNFLDYQKNPLETFDIILGNPPYISTSGNRLSETDKKSCQEIYDSAFLPTKKIKNIWTAFTIRCTQLLSKNGVLAFVLPSEILQTQAGQDICVYLKKYFQRIEFHVFKELFFKGAQGQETVVFFGFKQHSQSGEYYSVRKFNELADSGILYKRDSNPEIKDIHLGLFDINELNFLKNLIQGVKPVKAFASSKPGLVTAANHYFIVNQKTLEKYHLQEFARNLVQKSSFVNGKIEFTGDDFTQLVNSEKPVYFLDFTTLKEENISEMTKKYLELGLQAGLPDRYKMKKRENWFVVPGSRVYSEAFFFKRSHHYPKFILNAAKVLATDTAYLVNPLPLNGYDIKDIIFSFYNTLTLAFSELKGRFYGGGVLELTPTEFQTLPLPIAKIDKNKFETFSDIYQKSNSIEEVTDFTDFYILQKHLKLSKKTILKVNNLREILTSQRLKTNNLLS